MPTHDPRVDAYIAKSAPFARPILARIRELVHAGCPGVEETIKWSMPCFTYGDGLLCSMAAFKQHASFGFWKHALVTGSDERDGMGSYGKLASLADLPPKTRMLADIRKAAALNAQGVKPNRTRVAPKPEADVPADLAVALAKQRKAKSAFDAFPPSCRREYVDWIVEAKRPETRARRIAQAVEWMADGKRRNWKYENC